MDAFFSYVLKHAHPIVVHFPIALVVAAVLNDWVRVLRCRIVSPDHGMWLWTGAAVGAAVAVLTGPEGLARGLTEWVEPHERWGILTLGLTGVIVLWRLWLWWKRKAVRRMWGRAVYLGLTVVAVACVLMAGYTGGHMVYEEGIGVSVNGQWVRPPVSEWHHAE